jgi:hypothetical protein
MRAASTLDVGRVEREDGPESNWLDMVYLIDIFVGTITILAGLIVMAIVAGAFHVVTAGLVVGYCIMGIGCASVLLSIVRVIQRSRASREYQRARPPLPGN